MRIRLKEFKWQHLPIRGDGIYRANTVAETTSADKFWLRVVFISFYYAVQRP